MNAIDLAVTIPICNGETRFSHVLDPLRSPVGTEAFPWEIIGVNNS
ncbi:hypothetical protein NG791_11525 [Laspinema sp. D1]|nr:hypothetical protein [Laspinema sp. D2b]